MEELASDYVPENITANLLKELCWFEPPRSLLEWPEGRKWEEIES